MAMTLLRYDFIALQELNGNGGDVGVADLATLLLEVFLFFFF